MPLWLLGWQLFLSVICYRKGLKILGKLQGNLDKVAINNYNCRRLSSSPNSLSARYRLLLLVILCASETRGVLIQVCRYSRERLAATMITIQQNYLHLAKNRPKFKLPKGGLHHELTRIYSGNVALQVCQRLRSYTQPYRH